jgi:hypothetical protein
VERAINAHLWLVPALAGLARRRLTQQKELLDSLDRRAAAALSGIESLPRKSDALPPELAEMPPSMLSAFKTLAAFALAEQRRTSKPLEELLNVDYRPDGWHYGRSVQIEIMNEESAPAELKDATCILQFSPTDENDDQSNLRTYCRLLREFVVIDKAPESVLKRLDAIEALLSTEEAQSDDALSVLNALSPDNDRHALGMIQAIRYRQNPSNREGESLKDRFDEHWSKCLSNGARHFLDWVALGLLTDEE